MYNKLLNLNIYKHLVHVLINSMRYVFLYWNDIYGILLQCVDPLGCITSSCLCNAVSAVVSLW